MHVTMAMESIVYYPMLAHVPLLQVDRVSVPSEGNKAGLRQNDIIQSVTVVTAEGAVGPETKWSFDGISRTAKNSPSVCALLMTVMKY